MESLLPAKTRTCSPDFHSSNILIKNKYRETRDHTFLFVLGKNFCTRSRLLGSRAATLQDSPLLALNFK
jgi:hypothetical protein